MMFKKILILVFICLFSGSSFAGFSSKISTAVGNNLVEGRNFIAALENDEELGSDWLLSRIRMLSYGLIEFEIPFIEIKVMPMIEARWVKKYPGRVLYRPRDN